MVYIETGKGRKSHIPTLVTAIICCVSAAYFLTTYYGSSDFLGEEAPAAVEVFTSSTASPTNPSDVAASFVKPTPSSTPSTTTSSTTTSTTTTSSAPSFESLIDAKTGFPALTSEDDWKSIQAQCSEDNAGCSVYAMEKSGMGSALFGAFKHKIYTKMALNRPYYILDESRYMYYRSEDGSKGVLSTFFTPQFPVIDDESSFHYIDEILPKGQTMSGMIVGKPKKSAYWNTYMGASPIITLRRPDNRAEMNEFFSDGPKFNQQQLWEMMRDEMCPNLRYNEETKQRVAVIKDKHGFPDFSQLEASEKSVSFHVRRTDKVEQHESFAFTGDKYVAELVKQTGSDIDFEHCYVATDDATAVPEIEEALREANIHCRVWNLPDEKKAGGKQGKWIRSSFDESVIFLAELTMMVQSTYFVGTWDSNVSLMATVLRGCPENPHAGDEHFANSYDISGFGFMQSVHAGR